MIRNKMPETEEELREVISAAFPEHKSWCERSDEEKLAFRVLGSEYGPYVAKMLLELLDKERANPRMYRPANKYEDM